MEKWLNVWKVNYNGNGYGATPVYFDNLEAAKYNDICNADLTCDFVTSYFIAEV